MIRHTGGSAVGATSTRNLDKIETLVLGQLDGRRDRHDPFLFTLRVNNPDLGGIDFLVSPNALCDCDPGVLLKPTGKTGHLP
jgi:hypothetical protein